MITFDLDKRVRLPITVLSMKKYKQRSEAER